MKKSNTRGERRKTRQFFNFVSPIYPLIERNLAPSYGQALDVLDLNPDWDVLDLATGTGILAGAFAGRGHGAEGVDFSENLLRRARSQFPEVSFRSFDLVNLKDLPDNSRAIVCMGFLLHGLDAEFRQQILFQAGRIATERVVVFDYGREGNFLVRLIEWIEGPHYPGFLAASRHAEFAQAGLSIVKEYDFSEFGRVWSCEPSPENDAVC